MSTHFLTVENLKRVFPPTNGIANEPVFEDINFHIDKGEFVCIVGHSGCGADHSHRHAHLDGHRLVGDRRR